MTAEYKKIAKQGWSKDKKQSNRKLRNHEPIEIAEQLSEESPVRKVVKKSYNEKDITRTLSSLRYIHKFVLRHCSGDVDKLKFPDINSEWFSGVRQEYYQKYKKLIPEVTKLLERDDLPSKVRRQVIEVLTLFNIPI
jgi:hypothetical protein